MKNFIVVITTGEKIPIDEDEFPRVAMALANNTDFFARRGLIRGRLIGTIIEDIHRKKGIKYSYDIEKEREPYSNDKEMPDSFSVVRKNMASLFLAGNGRSTPVAYALAQENRQGEVLPPKRIVGTTGDT